MRARHQRVGHPPGWQRTRARTAYYWFIVTTRGKTTPASTAGSFSTHTGAKSRVETDSLASEIGLPALTDIGRRIGEYRIARRSDGTVQAFLMPAKGRGYTIAQFNQRPDGTWWCSLDDGGGMEYTSGEGATPVAALNAAEARRPTGARIFEPCCEVCATPTPKGDLQNGQCNACRDRAQDDIMDDMTPPDPDDEWEGIPMYFPNGAPDARRNSKSRACWFEDHICDVALKDGPAVTIEAEYLHADGWLSGRIVDAAGEPTSERANLPLADITSITIP